eukprot:2957860-Pyramimonas_sp.AAC.1
MSRSSPIAERISGVIAHLDAGEGHGGAEVAGAVNVSPRIAVHLLRNPASLRTRERCLLPYSME